MKHRSKAKKGQFSIIAALLTVTIMVSAVIMMYTTIRNLPFNEPPKILSSLEELNLSLKQLLEFSIGYYGSVMQVTGNVSYAKGLTLNYLQSGLVHIAHSHPEWNPSFEIKPNSLDFSTRWYEIMSYSIGNLSITYSMPSLGMSKITYNTSATLNVGILDTVNGKSKVLVTREGNKPDLTLGKGNFFFYKYSDSTWNLINPSTEPIVFSNGTYVLEIPSEVDQSSYLIKVSDSKGIMAIAFFSTSRQPRYTYTLTWNSTLYSSLTTDTIVVEALQNGTLRWLGQNLQFSTSAKPIIPIPVRILHVNQSISGISREVPFQVEDWGSNYRVPLGLTSNASLFGDRQMIVFLVNHNVQKVTLWWDGRDTAIQTSFAYTNRYFTKDDTNNGILTNENLTLILQDTYLYVNGFDWTNQLWTEFGSSPYLNDDATNYIRHNVNNQKEGWFSFQDLTSAHVFAFPALKSVKVDFECRREGSDDYFDFFISDGATTYGPYSITPPSSSSYSWILSSDDLSSTFNTVTKINNAKIEVRYRQNGGSASNIYIQRCRLVIDLGDWLTSVSGTSSAKADFMCINSKNPTYGSNLAYIIHHGIVRDVLHQEAEWSSGISENLYVDDFDWTYPSWTENGVDPYLHNTDGDYIRHNVNNGVEGWFSFQDMSINVDPGNVKIQFECYVQSGGDDYFQFEISNGTYTFGYIDINSLASSYNSPNSWKEYDLSSILDTWEEVNSARVRIRYKQSGSSASNVYIRRCRLYVATCPNVYSQIVITLPANVTYYTYKLRLMFLESQQNRGIADLCPIKITTYNGSPQTENGTSGGYPIVSNATGLFFNMSSLNWAHHWSQFISGTKGAGIMFTDHANQRLYIFDAIAQSKTGALKVSNTPDRTIELLPVTMNLTEFKFALDVTWNGAVVTFDGTPPIYQENDKMGLWIIIEYPPQVAVS